MASLKRHPRPLRRVGPPITLIPTPLYLAGRSFRFGNLHGNLSLVTQARRSAVPQLHLIIWLSRPRVGIFFEDLKSSCVRVFVTRELGSSVAISIFRILGEFMENRGETAAVGVSSPELIMLDGLSPND